MPVKLILVIILTIVIASFALINLDMVEISYYDSELKPQDTEVPLLIVVLLSLGFGFLLAWVDGWITRMKLKSNIRRNDKMIQLLNEELKEYKKPLLPETTESDK